MEQDDHFLFDDLCKVLYSLLDQENFAAAREVINDILKNMGKANNDEQLLIQYNLYGFLIDIGTESQTEDDLIKAIAFLKLNESKLTVWPHKASFYYNLANAFHGIAKIYYQKNPGIKNLDIQKQRFQDSINYYWMAFHNIGNDQEGLFANIAINISAALAYSGRIVEALQFLDIILNVYPDYPQALVTRGDHLHYLSVVSNCAYTIALFSQIYKSYKDAIDSERLPQSIKNRCEFGKAEALLKIQEHGFSIVNLDEELAESKSEFTKLSKYRQFCLVNFLSLNEHALYCNCIATKLDDLQIGVEHAVFKPISAKLELLLNRMKSEFAFARWCYYQSLQNVINIDLDTSFTDLLEGEVITSQTELQRTAYRICYGILDKIALGICKLYDIQQKRIHFETFWNDSKVKPILNDIKNLHLNALYSIACDLNTSTGELKLFKNWRNKIEHNLLILKEFKLPDEDGLNILSDYDFVTVADTKDFEAKLQHLLQLTRAAIFSYVFCVRLETIQHRTEETEKGAFMIRQKGNIG